MAFLHRFYAGGILANAVDGKDVRGYQLLSAGGNDRSFRVFSVIRSVLHKEYGQGEGLERKSHKLGIEKEEFLLPAVLEIAVLETVRRGGTLGPFTGTIRSRTFGLRKMVLNRDQF